MLTSFIQFNAVIGSTAEPVAITTASQAFNLAASLGTTDRLYYNTSTSVVASTTPAIKLAKKSKFVTKNIPAIKIGQKLLVIKGYSEDSPSIVNALEKEDTSLSDIPSPTFSPQDAIVPTTVEVAVSEDAGTTVLDQEGDISEYEVVSGDTVESIAKKFNLTPDTILWANDLKKTSQIHVGDKLVILPVSGVSYTIKSGDTLSEISEKFHVSQSELTEFNNIQDGKLLIGEVIIIPGGKIDPKTTENPSKTPSKNDTKKPVTTKQPSKNGNLSRPVVGGVRTQGIHGHNGVDIAASYGTPILAAADGYVSILRGGDGWNGGYGNYIVITHEKGMQTLYAHMSDIKVTQGQRVTAGQRVGSMGSTGKSTGVHLHFEVRGARNPF